MAIGSTVMDQIFKKNFLSNVRKNSRYFLKKLNVKLTFILNQICDF